MLVAASLSLGTVSRASAAGSDSVIYTFDKDSAVAQASVPLGVVLVGFQKGQLGALVLAALWFSALPASRLERPST